MTAGTIALLAVGAAAAYILTGRRGAVSNAAAAVQAHVDSFADRLYGVTEKNAELARWNDYATGTYEAREAERRSTRHALLTGDPIYAWETIKEYHKAIRTGNAPLAEDIERELRQAALWEFARQSNANSAEIMEDYHRALIEADPNAATAATAALNRIGAQALAAYIPQEQQ